MDQCKQILLVVAQGMDNAAVFDRAVARARRNEATLTLVDVIRKPPWIESSAEMLAEALWLSPVRHGNAPVPHEHLSVRALLEQAKCHRRKELDILAQQAGRQGVSVKTNVLAGVPFVEIAREVVRGKHDLVMIAAEARETLGSRFFGRTSMQLMRKCPAPVWVFKPSTGERHRRVLAAVDPAPYDDTRAALNRRIVALAVSIARLDGAALDLVYASGGAEKAVEMKWLSWMPDDASRKFAERLRRARRKAMDGYLSGYSLENLKHAVHILDGEPGNVIPEFAAKEKVELIVMGTVCRTGLAGFFMGNTAEVVLEKVGCSVLTLKPAGFVPPVDCSGAPA